MINEFEDIREKINDTDIINFFKTSATKLGLNNHY